MATKTKQKTVLFTVSKKDSDLITQIVDRAITAETTPRVIDRLSLTMDLTATHRNGCPLKLKKLLEAKPFDFSHDIYGIMRHLDRETGQLGDCFLPRYAA